MRNFNQWISDFTDDLSSLEVATLTNITDITEPLDLNKKLTKAADKTALEKAKLRVDNARTKLLEEIGIDDDVSGEEVPRSKRRAAIRKAKTVLREAERQLKETQKALGIYDPKDLFAKIRVALPTADLVAYSRFELEGDSMNFINSNPAVEQLVNKHHHMVAASQEARKALFDLALKRDKKGGPA